MYLIHYGIPRKSGRYPWGSGDRPYQSIKRVGGEYSLKKYTSPSRERAKNIPTRFALYTLSSIIPGFGLAVNANTLRQVAKYSFDRRDYTKREGSPEKVKELKKKTEKTSAKEDSFVVNPRIGKQAGKVNNCVNCSIAMEMRRRGYDVIARSSGSGKALTEYSDYFDGIKFEKSNSPKREFGENRKNYMNREYNNLCNDIEKFGDGSRGVIVIQYDKQMMSSGHAMFWEVHFYDGQNPEHSIDNVFSLSDPPSTVYARVDNLKIKPEITTTIVSRKEKKK